MGELISFPIKNNTNFLIFSNMKTKSESTTYGRANQTIDGFSEVFTTLRQQLEHLVHRKQGLCVRLVVIRFVSEYVCLGSKVQLPCRLRNSCHKTRQVLFQSI